MLSSAIDMGHLDAIVGALTTLVAAFAGAWFAFLFSTRDRQRDLINARVATGNRAIFTLLRQFNTLHNVKIQIIDPKRSDPLRLVNMRALSPLADLHVDLDALTFLLETDHRQVLGELMTADDGFQAAIQALNERSKFHREMVQPILRTAGVREGAETTPAEVESILGHAVYRELLQATDQAILLVDLALASTQAKANQLRDVLLDVHPKRSFIRFAPIEALPEARNEQSS